LLSGPAGFGQTSLLSEFVAQLRLLVAWLSLDEGDDDPILAACLILLLTS
jgi:LuxR family maltose regulon positive regulatory protein